MNTFDPRLINDAAIRDRYERVLRRGEGITRTLQHSFGGRPAVRFRFNDEAEFNAYVGRDATGYLIELGKPAPLFLAILFERLLAEPRLFPWLDTTGPPVSDYEVPFILDPAHFARRATWRIRLTRVRSLAADILADLSVAFIQLHEVGHVMSGHIEANQELTGSRRLAELLSSAKPGRRELERERAWEADADSIAASFLAQYVAELIEETKTNPLADQAFGRGPQTNEQVLTMACVALFAMFSYVRGARYSLGKRSSHPHPFIRANYVKDMLITAARRQFPVDLDVLAELLDTRLEEMLIALEGVGLSDNRRYDDAYMEGVDRELEHIIDIRSRHRASCAAHAWIPWTGSADELGDPLVA